MPQLWTASVTSRGLGTGKLNETLLSVIINMYLVSTSLCAANIINLSLSIPGQYHLQIEKAELDDEAPYECQAGQSESSGAIISSPAWVDVLSEQNNDVWTEGILGAYKHVFFVIVKKTKRYM